MRSIVSVLVVIALFGCASTSTKSLVKDESLHFELKNGYPANSHIVVTSFGRPLIAGVNLCKGVYKSNYKDTEGVYFKSVNNCHEEVCAGKNPCLTTGPGGIWIPNDKNPDKYEVWLPVGKTVGNGLLIDALDSIETGNFKKMGLYLKSGVVLEEINSSLGNRSGSE